MTRKNLSWLLLIPALAVLLLSPIAAAQEEPEPDCDGDIYSTFTPVLATSSLDAINNLIDLMPVMDISGLSLDPEPMEFMGCSFDANITMVEGSIVDVTAMNIQTTAADNYVRIAVGMEGTEEEPFFEGNADVELDIGGLCSLFGFFVSDGVYGFRLESGTLVQEAKACVTMDCDAIHPMYNNSIENLEFHIDLFEDGGGLFSFFGDMMDGMINSMSGMMADIFLGMFMDDETGPLLLNIFHLDITKDYFLVFPILDPPEVVDCITETGCGGGASTTWHPKSTAHQSASVIFYMLPAVVLFGLILWWRKEEQE